MLANVRQEVHPLDRPGLLGARVNPVDKLRLLTNGLSRSLLAGPLVYGWTTFIVVLGMTLGHRLIPAATFVPKPPRLSDCFANWDGGWYTAIVLDGYHFAPQTQCDVAFFPAYPFLGKLVMLVIGPHPKLALLIVSHLSFLAALVTLGAYVRLRFDAVPERLIGFVLFAAAVFPTGFFFRMVYSESLFLFCTILTFYLMERNASLLLVAGVIGFTTACRIPGICLLCPFILHVRHRSLSMRDCLQKLVCLTPLACWGIASFMLFTWYQFDEPLAFAKAQSCWFFRLAPSWTHKVYCLAVLEPFRSVFTSSSGAAYWKNQSLDKSAFLSLTAANPFYFGLAVVLIILGAYKRWLSPREWSFGAALLLMTYAGRGYEMCMQSSGRFVAVVFPIYLVLGQLLCRCPPPLAAGFLAICAVFLTIYSALFAACHFLI